MKLVTYYQGGKSEKAGFWIDGHVYDAHSVFSRQGVSAPETMQGILDVYGEHESRLQDVYVKLCEDLSSFQKFSSPQLGAPLPRPRSCRDAYAFRQHVEAMRRNRGVEMIPEFDQFPIFYFTNHQAIMGEGEFAVQLDHLRNLDFELEWAAVLGKSGRNFSLQEAEDAVFGFTIMNDMSARVLQLEEMKLSLGPAKGKDFGTVIGPWLVTKDELESHRVGGPQGSQWDLRMTATHNGRKISDGNTKSMTWTWAEILERISYGVEMFPGEVVGSGTVGTGCYAELNGTWRKAAEAKGESYQPVWLQDGDEIELSITGLGTLKNTIRKISDLSILAKKKNV